MINKEILNILDNAKHRPIWDTEADVWQAIADEHGLDVDEISDGDLAEWL
jgi:hypothetical protein